MKKPYTDISSRLCSENCEASYNAHVFGDRTAHLGSGKRLLLWLQREQLGAYRRLIGAAAPKGRYCQNPNCARGENSQPTSLAHLREGSRFCSTECRKQAHRESGPQPVLPVIFRRLKPAFDAGFRVPNRRG